MTSTPVSSAPSPPPPLSLASLTQDRVCPTDLSSLFSWNTKQIFVYVTATFPSKSPSSPYSEAIIWDAIIPSPSAPWHQNTYIHPSPKLSSASAATKKARKNSKKPASLKAYPEGAQPGILRLGNQKPKYQITTPWSKIGGVENCTLHLRYNIQPWVGALTWSSGADRGVWTGLEGESSEAFDMPNVKSAAGVSASKSLKDELKTETGGEKNRGSPA